MNLELITYGNPTKEQLKSLNTKTYCDVLFAELSSFRFPKNSSDETKEELNQIVEYLNAIESDEQKIKTAYKYDKSLLAYLKKGIEKDNIPNEEVNALIDQIAEDINPLLMKLKFHFQRPRPYQLAEYYKLKLFPYASCTANSPSFPSGHAYQATIITTVIGNMFPELYNYMQVLAENICYSRIFMGLHYQSDIDLGIFAGTKVLQLKEFKTKYKL